MTFEQDMSALERRMDKALQNATIKTAKLVIKEARGQGVSQGARKFKHSKSFDDAIVYQPHDPYSGEVVSQKPYSFWLEYGNAQSGPLIYPRTAKALHFFVNGKEVFANYVHAHEPYYFMRDAREVGEAYAEGIFNNELARVLKPKYSVIYDR